MEKQIDSTFLYDWICDEDFVMPIGPSFPISDISSENDGMSNIFYKQIVYRIEDQLNHHFVLTIHHGGRKHSIS
jgi:hypothetical protein